VRARLAKLATGATILRLRLLGDGTEVLRSAAILHAEVRRATRLLLLDIGKGGEDVLRGGLLHLLLATLRVAAKATSAARHVLRRPA